MDTNSTGEQNVLLRGIAVAIEQLPAGVFVVDREGRIHAANRKARRRLGPRGEAQLRDICDHSDRTIASRLEPVFGSSVGRIVRFDLSDGTVMTVSGWRLAGVEGGDGPLALLEMREVGALTRRFFEAYASERESKLRHSLRRQEQLQREAAHLRKLSATDRMTGLLNAAEFSERAETAIRRLADSGAGAALIYIDLDHFKPVNDTFGHDAGDMVLCNCARILSDAVREEDLVGRLGGDEFCLLLCDVLPEDIELILSRIHARIALPQPWPDPDTDEVRQIRVTASVGVARAPGDGEDLAALRRIAEGRMYCDKRGNGRPIPG